MGTLLAVTRAQFARQAWREGSAALGLLYRVNRMKVEASEYPAILAMVKDMVSSYGLVAKGSEEWEMQQLRRQLEYLLRAAFTVWEGNMDSYLGFLQQQALDPDLAHKALRYVLSPGHSIAHSHQDPRGESPRDATDLAIVTAHGALEPRNRRLALYHLGGLRAPLEDLLREKHVTPKLLAELATYNTFYAHPERLPPGRLGLLEDLLKTEADETNKVILSISVAQLRKVVSGDTAHATRDSMRKVVWLTVRSYWKEEDQYFCRCTTDTLVPKLKHGEDLILVDDSKSTVPRAWLRVEGILPDELQARISPVKPVPPETLVGKSFWLRRP